MADGAGEAYYRTTADALSRDNALLRERVDKLEKANRLLMRSVFELSAALSAASIPAPPLHLVPDEDTVPDDRPPLTPMPKVTSSEKKGSDLGSASVVPTSLTASASAPSPGDSPAPTTKLIFAEKSEWSGHKGAVYALSFAATGRMLAAAGFDRAVRLWDMAKGELAVVLSEAHSGPISDVGWSADGNEVMSAGLDARIKIWDATKSRMSGQWELSSFVAQIAQHPPEPQLFAACGGEKGVVLIFDRRSPVPARRLHDGEVSLGAVIFTRTGELVSGDADGVLRLWDAKREGQPLRRWNASGDGNTRASITNICPSGAPNDADDRCLLVNSYDNAVRLWRRLDGSGETHKLVHTLQGVKGRHWPIRASMQAVKEQRAERWLAASGSADGSIFVWDLLGKSSSSYPPVQHIAAHPLRCYGALFHPTEPMFASCAADGVVKFFAAKP